ncbi:MAG TPA: hypothetical protein DCX17_01165 [Firmicutes bacterium]|nr:hypothetical protein [Bacillota bacterium]
MHTIYLFLDDRRLNVRKNVLRVTHQAKKIQKELYVDPATSLVNLAWGYPFVFFHPGLDKTIMLYQGWSIDRNIITNTLSLAAYSDDGLNFAPFDMSGNDIGEKRILANQVLPYRLNDFIFAEGQFFYLPNLTGERKFLALCIYKGQQNVFKAYVFTSRDGLSYRHEQEVLWHDGNDAPDYPLSVVYESKNCEYLLYRRPRHTDRRIAVSHTKDFRTFSEPQLILQSDALDRPMTDFYGLTAFNYADYVIGLLMVYETPNYLVKDGKRVSGLPGHKFDGGPVIPQLAYSSDGNHFLRGERKSIIDNEQYPCVYPTCVTTINNSIRVYASVTSEEHGRVAPGKGGIAIYEWRKDGFVSLHFSIEGGLVITRQFIYRGGPLLFNIDVIEGSVRIQIGDDDNKPLNGFSFDDCAAFAGNELTHEFSFNKCHVNDLKGQVLVISVMAHNTDLFSISGDIEWLTPYQAMIIRQEKTPL